jgi:hypothetical protein
LVEFPRGYDLFSQRLPLAEQLAHLLKRHVDLVPEHELNRHIREQVLSKVFIFEYELLQCDHMWQITTREEIDPDTGIDP